MPLPGDLNLITVTGTYLDMQGNPLSGSVTFTPSTAPLADTTGEVTLAGIPVAASLTAEGTISVVLPCTDQMPAAGYWVWQVTENITGSPARTYGIALPHSLGSTVDLSTLAPVTPPAAFASPNVWAATQTFGGTPAIVVPAGAGNGYIWTSDADGNGSWQPAAPLAWVNVKSYGATGNGVTDDSAAIQDAINAASAVSGTVYFPAGTYYSAGTALTVTAPIRLTGTSASVLLFASSGGINFSNTYISAGSFNNGGTVGLEIDHLVFDVTGGDIFYNCNWNNFSLHDLRLIQRSAGHAVWSCSGSVSLLAGLVSNVVSNVAGTGRTVPGWNLVSSIGGGIALLTFLNCHFGNLSHDNAQPAVWIECNGTHNYTASIKWVGCTWDSAYGGAVHALSAKYWSFDTCEIIDTSTYTVAASMFYLGASTGGSQWPSDHVTFRDCSRDLQGPNGSSYWDIYCESTCDTITVASYGVRDIPGVSIFYPYFNFSGCTNVLIENCPGAVVTSAPSSGVTLGPGGNISYTGTLAGAAFPDTTLPGDLGFQAWTSDPAEASGGGTLAVGGTVYLAAIYTRGSITINYLYFSLTNAASGAVSGENYIGIYSSSGTLLGSVEVTSALGTTDKMIKATLSSSLTLSAGYYWVAVVFNASTTEPQLMRANNTNFGVYNGELGTSSLRYTSNGTGQTSLPSSITPSGNSTTTGIPFWAAAG